METTWRARPALTARLAFVSLTMLLVLVVGATSFVVGSRVAPPATDDARLLIGTPAPAGPGAFTPTGPMAAIRLGLTLTTLHDGRVLAVGGPAEAEIWDPASGTFSPAGSLTSGRVRHTATLLRDGRVLVIGGRPVDGEASTSGGSAEIFDPTTGTWSQTGPFGVLRHGHTATLLADGRVLVLGGSDVDGTAIASAEVWDPVSGTFGPAGSLRAARTDHSATTLPDGTILVAGGDTSSVGFNWGGGTPLDGSELWDPAIMTSEATGGLTHARYGHTATLLEDGRVLVVGGGDSGFPDAPGLASAEVWDPATGTFNATGSPVDGREGHAAILLRDGRVLVVGGFADSHYPGLASAELWDPATGSFSTAAAPLHGYMRPATALLADGGVLVAGAYVTRETLICQSGQPAPTPGGRCSGISSSYRPEYGPAAELFDSTP